MRYRNIAVLMTALDSMSQSQALRGIEEYGKSHGCNIAVFLWFTGAFEEEMHNLGEINIVNLPDLSLFDGVIVFSNALHIEYNRKAIEDVLDKVTCPVVCMGCQIKDYYTLCTDNYSAMRELIEHFIYDHGVRDIHFVKGIEGNEDAAERYRAYEDVLRENNIPILPERISRGDFYVTGGEVAAEEILNCVLSMPQAVVCANDMMAITVCDIMMEKGYSVPGDIMVAGYDYSLEAQVHSPQITSIRTNFRKFGNIACEILLQIIEGKEVNKNTLLPDEVIYTESCNCVNTKESEERSKERGVYGDDMSRRLMIHHLLNLEKSFTECKGLDDWMKVVEKFVSCVDVSEFYCCVNDGFVDKVFEMDVMEQEEMTISQRLSYSKTVYPIIAYMDGVFKTKRAFESKYALDDMFKNADKCKLYVFSPLHYLERMFGYLVFVDSDFVIANQLYISALINMGGSMENIRKQIMLRNAMKKLDDMYIRDSLTGVYNRFGLERYFAEIKRKCIMSRINMQLSFIDLDNLKVINDKWGHEAGDSIITAAASILTQETDKNYVIRYGGDEFIVIGTVRDENEVEEYWNRVFQKVEYYNNTHENAKLSFSVGYDVFHLEAKTTLEECIRVVDQKMYTEKRRKKQRQ